MSPDGLVWRVAVTVLLACCCSCTDSPGPEVVEIRHEVATSGYLQVGATLEEGALQVMLPGGFRAGDTISGWVSALEDGKSWRPVGPEHAFSGFTLEIGDAVVLLEAETVVVTVPAAPEGLRVALLDSERDVRATGFLPIAPASAASAGDERIVPPFIPSGGMLRLPGPYDGDLRNTLVQVAGMDCEVWTESPREAFVMGHDWPAGPTEVRVVDQGVERLFPVTVLHVNSRILRRDGAELVIRVHVGGFGRGASEERPVLEIGIWHDGGLQQEQALELDPARAVYGDLILTASFVVEESVDFRYRASLRRDW